MIPGSISVSQKMKRKRQKGGIEKRPSSPDFIIPTGSLSPVCFSFTRSIIKTKQKNLFFILSTMMEQTMSERNNEEGTGRTTTATDEHSGYSWHGFLSVRAFQELYNNNLYLWMYLYYSIFNIFLSGRIWNTQVISLQQRVRSNLKKQSTFKNYNKTKKNLKIK